jgi:hypothetical protein
MGWRTLLVTHDKFLECAFEPAVSRQNSELEVVAESPSAQKLIAEIRFGLLIVDCDDVYGGAALLRATRLSLPNRSSMVLAVTNGDTQPADALDLGANQVLSKPIPSGVAESELETLSRSIEPNQRADQRFSLKIAVFVSFGQVAELRAETFNISQGGIGIHVSEPITQDDLLHLRCCLPGTLVPIQAHGEIAWADREGNCGIRFIGMGDCSRHVLLEWLEMQQGLLPSVWRK